VTQTLCDASEHSNNDLLMHSDCMHYSVKVVLSERILGADVSGDGRDIWFLVVLAV
jgi:hypothetical protein